MVKKLNYCLPKEEYNDCTPSGRNQIAPRCMPLFAREARVRRSGIQRISRRSGIQRISTDNLSGINFDGRLDIRCIPLFAREARVRQMSAAGSFQKSRNSSVELFFVCKIPLYAKYLCSRDALGLKALGQARARR